MTVRTEHLASIRLEAAPGSSGLRLLSSGQERLWFLQRLDRESPAYNVACAWHLAGNLDEAALQRSLREMVRRHESLRTRFVLTSDGPRQRTENAGGLTHSLVDVAAVPPDQQHGRLGELARAEVERPFDLSACPLIRATLFRCAPSERVLLVVAHHIVVDGWSLGVLAGELSALYAAFSQGRPSPLPELSSQYADWAEDERDRLAAGFLDPQIEYWASALAGVPALLHLPHDRPRPRQMSFRGATESAALPAALAEQLSKLARGEGVTIFMLALAAFQVFLSRLSGQEDLTVGCPVSGRTELETEPLIGHFVNTLVFRADLTENPTFREFLRRVRRVAVDAYSNQDAPLDKVVDAIAPDRSLSCNPLFQAALLVANDSAELDLPGISVHPLAISPDVSRFDLTVSVSFTRDGPGTTWEYASDLFEASTVRRFMAYFQELLESIVSNPDERVRSLRMLPDSERKQMLLGWNDTRKPYPASTIDGLFREQALRRPNATALVCDERTVTYGELDAHSEAVAAVLEHLGVRAGDTVAVCGARSTELIAGFLGALKAGAGYLPIDPRESPERLSLMLRESAVRVVLADGRASAADFGSATVIRMDRPLPPAPARGSRSSGSLDACAYINYTSGSQGTPKGVAIPHRAVVRLLFGADYARFGPNEVFLHLSPIAFDASTFEIWGPLLHGGCCVIHAGEDYAPSRLGELIRANRVTTLWLTSSLFNALIDEAPEILHPIKQLLTGGEALSPPHVRRALDLLPSTELVNGYGPTESTTFACCWKIPRDFSGESRSVPIGRPIANTQVFILDGALQPVPVGVVGEIVIGGDGLALGYIGAPELTAEKFVSNPFGESGERLYRTGDLGRFRPDGVIEFAGRRDEQIKLNGFRIEPGEIEAALVKHPAIRQARVAVRAVSGAAQLVAYAAVAPQSGVSAADAMVWLNNKLPRYMLPARVVFINKLPLLPNGKLDHRALPESPEPVRSTPAVHRDPVEFRLSRIWCSLLKRSAVGIHDNFFELGGNSLLVARMLARVDKEFGRKLRMTDLFEAPTVEQFARRLWPDAPPLKYAGCAALQPLGSRTPFFCVDAGPRFLPLARRMGPDRPFLGLPVPHDCPTLPQDLSGVTDELVRLLRSLQPKGPYFIGGWSLKYGMVAYDLAQRLVREGDEVGLLVLFDVFNPARAAGSAAGLSPLSRVPGLSRRRTSRSASTRPLADRFRQAAARVQRLTWLARYELHSRLGVGDRPSAGREESPLYWAARGYRPEPYPGRTILFRAEADLARYPQDSLLGWEKLIPNIELEIVPGDHATMFDQSNADHLATQLQRRLARGQLQVQCERA